MSNDRFEQLYELYCERSLSGAERAEFEALLSDAAMRQRFFELLNFDTQLIEEAKLPRMTPRVLKTRPAGKPGDSGKLWLGLSAAALVIISVLGMLYFDRSNIPPAVTVAIVEKFEGSPVVRRGTSDMPLRVGLELQSGDSVQTQATQTVSCRLAADATNFHLHAASVLRLQIGPERKALALDVGELSAVVMPQPQNAPLIIATPGAESLIVGTRFTIQVAQQHTTLKVDEGHVRLKRLNDGTSVDVKTGTFAVCSPEQSPTNPQAVPEVVSVTLLDASTGKPHPKYNPLPPGTEVFSSQLKGPTAVLANTSGAVSSVKFETPRGPAVIISKAPFILPPVEANRSLKHDSPTTVRYSFKITPYSGPNGTGVAGKPYQIDGRLLARDQEPK